MENQSFFVPVLFGVSVFLLSLIVRWNLVDSSAIARSNFRQKVSSIEAPLTNLSVNLISISASLWLFVYGIDVQKSQSDTKSRTEFVDYSDSVTNALVTKSNRLIKVRSRLIDIEKYCKDNNRSSNYDWVGRITTVISVASYLTDGSNVLTNYVKDNKDALLKFGPQPISSFYRVNNNMQTIISQAEVKRDHLSRFITLVIFNHADGKNPESYANEVLQSEACAGVHSLKLALNATTVEGLSAAFEICIMKSATAKGDNIIKTLKEEFRKSELSKRVTWEMYTLRPEFFDGFAIGNLTCADYTSMYKVKSLGQEWSREAGDQALRN